MNIISDYKKGYILIKQYFILIFQNAKSLTKCTLWKSIAKRIWINVDITKHSD